MNHLIMRIIRGIIFRLKLRYKKFLLFFGTSNGILLERQIVTQDIYIPASIQHQKVFPKYKGIHRGEDIVICGTGPTFDYYKPIENAIHIAINYAVYRKDIYFNYIFYSDYSKDDKIFDYIADNMEEAIKFYLISPNLVMKNAIIPIRYREQKNVETYYNDPYDYIIRGKNFYRSTKYMFHPDISVAPLKGYGTTAFPAIQVALWMRPKRIFLVGLDCSKAHAKGLSYDDVKEGYPSYSYLIPAWKELKEFASDYYDDTEIISINPVGLKGLFTDIYTDEYQKRISETSIKS